MEALDSELLFHIVELVNFDLATIASLSCTSRHFAEFSRTQLWPAFCLTKSSEISKAVTTTAELGQIQGSWTSLVKLLSFCPGNHPGKVNVPSKGLSDSHVKIGGHFSIQTGRSLLMSSCQFDSIFAAPTCRHQVQNEEVGTFQGFITDFSSSETRKQLMASGEHAEGGSSCEGVNRCFFCNARVWDAAPVMSPTVNSWLGCYEDGIKAFICHNGHLYGTCRMLPLPPVVDNPFGLDHNDLHYMLFGNDEDDFRYDQYEHFSDVEDELEGSDDEVLVEHGVEFAGGGEEEMFRAVDDFFEGGEIEDFHEFGGELDEGVDNDEFQNFGGDFEDSDKEDFLEHMDDFQDGVFIYHELDHGDLDGLNDENFPEPRADLENGVAGLNLLDDGDGFGNGVDNEEILHNGVDLEAWVDDEDLDHGADVEEDGENDDFLDMRVGFEGGDDFFNVGEEEDGGEDFAVGAEHDDFLDIGGEFEGSEDEGFLDHVEEFGEDFGEGGEEEDFLGHSFDFKDGGGECDLDDREDFGDGGEEEDCFGQGGEFEVDDGELFLDQGVEFEGDDSEIFTEQGGDFEADDGDNFLEGGGGVEEVCDSGDPLKSGLQEEDSHGDNQEFEGEFYDEDANAADADGGHDYSDDFNDDFDDDYADFGDDYD